MLAQRAPDTDFDRKLSELIQAGIRLEAWIAPIGVRSAAALGPLGPGLRRHGESSDRLGTPVPFLLPAAHGYRLSVNAGWMAFVSGNTSLVMGLSYEVDLQGPN